jgi:hypothetical protein
MLPADKSTKRFEFKSQPSTEKGAKFSHWLRQRSVRRLRVPAKVAATRTARALAERSRLRASQRSRRVDGCGRHQAVRGSYAIEMPLRLSVTSG